MARPAFVRAARHATDLIASLELKVPVDLRAVADHLDIHIRDEEYGGGTSGILVREADGTKIIGVNTRHPATRQRFTIAHELGHAVLHLEQQAEGSEDLFIDKPRELLFRDDRTTLANDRREIEANAIAAELLMPALAVRREFSELVIGQASLDTERIARTLADQFAVSTQAITYRLMNLSLLDPV